MEDKRDLYEIIGVPRDADADAIRKRYRVLARELHPDLKPDDPAAEERFKQVSQAYGVLRDPDKRRAYDEFGHASLDSGFDADEARRMKAQFRERQHGAGGFESFFGGRGREPDSFEGADFDDLLGSLFGGAAGRAGGRPRARPARGADVETRIELDFLEAIRGGEKTLQMQRPGAGIGEPPKTVTVRFPPGVSDGDRLRVRGQGEAGPGGTPAGDLWVRVRVRPHPVFERVGHDLSFELPISAREAMLGAEVEVPTPDGRAQVRVPPGTDSGTKLRLRGKGVPRRKGGAGDLFARVKIVVPDELDTEAREMLEKLERFEDPELRKKLFP